MISMRSQPQAIQRRAPAFTLIEIMIVTAIIALVMGMSIPLVKNIHNKGPMRQTVTDMLALCSNARAQAILQGKMTQIVFHPTARRAELSGAGAAATESLGGESAREAAHLTAPGSLTSCQFAEQIMIDMLDVNLSEYRDADSAIVRFYPNGTCDEMTLIIRSPEGELCEISLEVTTSLASVEHNPKRFR